MTKPVSADELRDMLQGRRELALLDVREEGVFFESHLLFARPLPLSRLELKITDLVPRPGTPIVLCDADDGLAERAAARLAEFGYTDVSILEGGVAGWENAGNILFSGYNVPSKAFGEYVEHRSGTPSVSAQELKELMESGTDMVVLDSRPWDEYHRMNIPTGIDMPGAELAYRVHDAATSPDTLVVVNCAGRTRSIIGAQSLINAGIPNKVVALRNGTMGWELSGFKCEVGGERRAPDPSPTGLEAAKAVAERVTARFGVKTIDMATLDTWRREDDRSIYLLDVRGPEEYAAGHMPGSVSAPGGQLVQATDLYVGTLNSRVVLIDDTGVRAAMTASWLIQMGGYEPVVLQGGLDAGGLDAGALETGPYKPRVLGLDRAAADTVEPSALKSQLDRGEATVVDLSDSYAYRRAHIPGAWFAVRARLDGALSRIPVSGALVFTCPDGTLARLAAADIGEEVAVLGGGNAAWAEAGLGFTVGAENMADETDDVVLKPYDRPEGVEAAMKAYLSWEVDLVRQVEQDGTTRFRHFPA